MDFDTFKRKFLGGTISIKNCDNYQEFKIIKITDICYIYAEDGTTTPWALGCRILNEAEEPMFIVDGEIIISINLNIQRLEKLNEL